MSVLPEETNLSCRMVEYIYFIVVHCFILSFAYIKSRCLGDIYISVQTVTYQYGIFDDVSNNYLT